MSNEVIWYDSSETGAPTLNNVAGSMIAVLDACLINGFNVKSVTSIVVASNVATVTCTGHGYSNSYGKLVKIAGATPAGLNGNKQITVTGANTFTFVTSGISDQTATGTIDARRAPLGTWQKAYTGTNKAMYRSTDTGASGALLRVEDALSGGGCTATSARVRMVEAASGVDTFTIPCPTVAQLTDGGYWQRGANTATAKTWRLIGDGRFFWFLTQLSTGTSHAPYLFGDYLSYKAGDLTNAVVGFSSADPGGSTNSTTASIDGATTLAAASVAIGFPTLLRANNGVGTSIYAACMPTIVGMPTNPGIGGVTYPSPIDGGLVIAYPTQLFEPSIGIRGAMPALGYSAANISAVPDLTILDALQNSSRKFLVAYASNTNVACAPLFDLTGPWR